MQREEAMSLIEATCLPVLQMDARVNAPDPQPTQFLFQLSQMHGADPLPLSTADDIDIVELRDNGPDRRRNRETHHTDPNRLVVLIGQPHETQLWPAQEQVKGIAKGGLPTIAV